MGWMSLGDDTYPIPGKQKYLHLIKLSHFMLYWQVSITYLGHFVISQSVASRRADLPLFDNLSILGKITGSSLYGTG
jgi:hypothetical protein